VSGTRPFLHRSQSGGPSGDCKECGSQNQKIEKVVAVGNCNKLFENPLFEDVIYSEKNKNKNEIYSNARFSHCFSSALSLVYQLRTADLSHQTRFKTTN
jgi:hypothetical protein